MKLTLKIFLKHNNTTIEVEQGTSLKEIAARVEDDFDAPITLAIVDGKLKEIYKQVKSDCEVEFLDLTNKDGYRTYQRSLTLLFIKSLRDVYQGYGINHVDVRVQFTIQRGLYCEVLNVEEKPLTQEIIKEIEDRMKAYVDIDAVIYKSTVTTSKAIKLFAKQGMKDKVCLLKYRSVSNTNIYELDGFYDYYFGYMVPSYGKIGKFELHPHDEGVMVQYVSKAEPKKVAPFKPALMLFDTQKETSRWAQLMDVTTIGELNELIAAGDINDLLLVAEALMEKRIASIADEIVNNQNKKRFIFIAGPSSSGKTTFAHRLGIQLRAFGMNPKTISLDNYFVNREQTPLDEYGNFNFETIDAIDRKLFNENMLELLAGQSVDIPHFNFISGKREYRDNPIELGDNGILIVEGIHGLNDMLSYDLPKENTFKIYISAMTQLNLDYHNRIPTTDGRLLRRIVRDYQYRGVSALQTIRMWESVRRGEEKYIFPFQEKADVMFNSALIYEIAVLKQYADPLLYSIPDDCPEHIEAKRLIKFLDYILGVTSEHIPQNSLIREFIGGSCFRT